MGLFSSYCGFIYNDAFAKSINIFGTGWTTTNYTDFIRNNNNKILQLDPRDSFKSVYFYGMDPIWQISENNIVWMNSFKMKSSIVLGITHMIFGLVLQFKNHVY